MYYEYIPSINNSNTLQYKVTIKVYRDCNQNGSFGPGDVNNPQNDATAPITIYFGTGNQVANTVVAQRVAIYPLSNTYNNPCLSPAQSVCYYIIQYEATITVQPNAEGYTLSYQRCCRIAGISNVTNSGSVGNTYTSFIPGTAQNPTFPRNSSPKFVEKDTVIVCYNSFFSLDYGATDADNDSLAYQLCGGYDGGASSTGNPAPGTASPPPYTSIGYSAGYSGGDPFGTSTSINTRTGLISGMAPATPGEYVLSVCVSEFRNGVLLGITHKELHIRVGNCTLAGAKLDPQYTTCDGFSYQFQNESPASNIQSYLWNFGDPATGAGNTSTQPTPTHTFSDTGRYSVKLKVVATGGCQDSATMDFGVFPGFFAGFMYTGSCFLNPFQFTDTTRAVYGAVNKWIWNFGDPQNPTAGASVKNPAYTYPTSGSKTVQLIVSSSKGCIDTVTHTLQAFDKPPITLPFRDTLICSIDTLQLQSSGSGAFSWSPAYNIINPATPTPLVYPKRNTTYILTLQDNGCSNTDSVKVQVVDFVTVSAGADSTICLTDTAQLHASGNGLSFAWSSLQASTFSNNNIASPRVLPASSSTDYIVVASIGKCSARDTVRITAIPYPQINAGNDTTICFGDTAHIVVNHIVASQFTWSPQLQIINTNTLSPSAFPSVTRRYIITVRDNLGCPKPVSDTVLVRVIPQVRAFAGNDTSVVVGQTLQLNATGGDTYAWSPATYLSNPTIANPTATFPAFVDTIFYRVTATVGPGCTGTDGLRVVVYKTMPDILVPSGFTPNNDGRNDILKPILIGIRTLKFFRLYNRWGQLIYTTSEPGKGWDGNINGTPQGSGTFVYITEGTDFLGNTIVRKGTVVLIR